MPLYALRNQSGVIIALFRQHQPEIGATEEVPDDTLLPEQLRVRVRRELKELFQALPANQKRALLPYLTIILDYYDEGKPSMAIQFVTDIGVAPAVAQATKDALVAKLQEVSDIT